MAGSQVSRARAWEFFVKRRDVPCRSELAAGEPHASQNRDDVLDEPVVVHRLRQLQCPKYPVRRPIRPSRTSSLGPWSPSRIAQPATLGSALLVRKFSISHGHLPLHRSRSFAGKSTLGSGVGEVGNATAAAATLAIIRAPRQEIGAGGARTISSGDSTRTPPSPAQLTVVREPIDHRHRASGSWRTGAPPTRASASARREIKPSEKNARLGSVWQCETIR